ncbi:MAG: hypothetical protein ACRCTL_01755 [Pseudomonas sp.]
MIKARHYRKGDIASINSAEDNPFANWNQHVERNAKRMVSFERSGQLIAVIGYTEVWDGVADAFAVIDREHARGAGKELAAEINRCIIAIMDIDNLHRVQATCHAEDRVAAVFLRAAGYKLESRMIRASANGSDMLMHTIIRSQ